MGLDILCSGLYPCLSSIRWFRSKQSPIYEPLAFPGGIRLLHLEPGRWTDELKGTLHHYYFPEEPATYRATVGGGIRPQRHSEYEAVSYTWGASGDTARILLNGTALEIPEGGYEALRRLRQLRQARTLWIDCVCINQDDVLERNAQVQRMHHTFGDAQRVLVYVGEHDEASEQLLDVLQIIGSPEMRQLDSYASACEQMQSETLMKAMDAFLHRRWFSRIWVVQEVYFAASALLLCGDREITWSTFQHAVKIWEREILSIKALDNLPRVLEPVDGEVEKLLPLLQSTRSCGATNPRDKVYAVKNLLRQSSIGEVRYDRTTARIYVDVAVCELQATGSLELLSYVQSEGFTPSWVPDWSDAGALSTLGELSVYGSSRTARLPAPPDKSSEASEGTILQHVSGFKLDLSTPRLPRLHVSAVRFGRVTALKDPFQRSARARHKGKDAVYSFRNQGAISRNGQDPRLLNQEIYEKEAMSVSLAGLGETASSLKDDVVSTREEQMLPAALKTPAFDGSEANDTPLARSLTTKQRDAAYHTLRMMGLPTTARNLRALFGRRRVDIAYFNIGSNDSLTARSTLVPGQTEPGDAIYYIFGPGKTFVLRKIQDARSDQAFRLIGECYAPDLIACRVTFEGTGESDVVYFHGTARRGYPCPESGTLRVRKEDIVLL